MFVKEEGKESPVIINQEETAVLETEGGIRILLRTEAADKITASLEIRQRKRRRYSFMRLSSRKNLSSGRRHIWILQKVFLTGWRWKGQEG